MEREREIESDGERERERERGEADNIYLEQSRVAQLVLNTCLSILLLYFKLPDVEGLFSLGSWPMKVELSSL